MFPRASFNPSTPLPSLPETHYPETQVETHWGFGNTGWGRERKPAPRRALSLELGAWLAKVTVVMRIHNNILELVLCQFLY